MRKTSAQIPCFEVSIRHPEQNVLYDNTSNVFGGITNDDFLDIGHELCTPVWNYRSLFSSSRCNGVLQFKWEIFRQSLKRFHLQWTFLVFKYYRKFYRHQICNYFYFVISSALLNLESSWFILNQRGLKARFTSGAVLRKQQKRINVWTFGLRQVKSSSRRQYRI